MRWFWIAGYLFAIVLIVVGLSRQTRFKIASKQVFVGLGFFVLIAMTAIVLDTLYNWSQHVPDVWMAILGCGIVLYRAIGILRHRLRGGALLIDLGRVPIGEFLIEIIVAGALAANALIDGAKAIESAEWTINDISFEVLELSVAFAVFVQGILRRSVMEKGIFHGTGLIPWDKIDSFAWEEVKRNARTLILQKQSPLAMLRTVTLSVNAEQVESVEGLLRQHNVKWVGDIKAESSGNP